MRTIQCESINFAIKKDLQHVKKYTLCDFISQLDFALSKLRHTELHFDYISKHTMLELLPPINVLRTY
ncbi:LOW QUALITY PROTEIN: hypothetical protein PanWU01x14_017100 [Parasponia andersonii]|uniref:Uncharacterized protein n=1 Tax=Parasponia andersonii TaxID=3476 RepID=A0A2P5DZU2_PARAD|nr:LOW QUALITY PROTEIN: hypothetical protein PanWU01x14_017100 [Parasponia andersonii]